MKKINIVLIFIFLISIIGLSSCKKEGIKKLGTYEITLGQRVDGMLEKNQKCYYTFTPKETDRYYVYLPLVDGEFRKSGKTIDLYDENGKHVNIYKDSYGQKYVDLDANEEYTWIAMFDGKLAENSVNYDNEYYAYHICMNQVGFNKSTCISIYTNPIYVETKIDVAGTYKLNLNLEVNDDNLLCTFRNIRGGFDLLDSNGYAVLEDGEIYVLWIYTKSEDCWIKPTLEKID